LKILFVCSGNSVNGIGAVVSNQAEALKQQGIDISFFSIKGKGWYAYLKHVLLLRKYLRKNIFDIIHAHYSLSAFTATLAGSKPLVVSLMGSDARAGKITSSLIRFYNKKRWAKLIVKSDSMKEQLRLKDIDIIPNGVDFTFFKPIDDTTLKSKFGFSENKQTILFLADPAREAKNFPLAEQAFEILDTENTELQVRYNIPKEEIPQIINAADIILLTSLWEGSPNVIKESMACSKPIVATNVGDIAWLFGDEPGHFLSSFDPEDVAEKMKMALEFSKKHGRTNGRERIIELGLDAETVAQKIISVYQSVIEHG
jgi:glycosyltransferase involved in cell wall biosynthesis